MRADIEKIIKEYGVNTFLNEKNIKRAEEQLRSDETVLYLSPTNAIVYTGKNKKSLVGTIVITNQRVFLYSKVLFSVTIESFNMTDLNSIESTSNGLSGSKLKLHTNTKTMEVLISYKSSIATKIIQLLDTTMNEAKNKNQSSIAPTDNIDQIKKLAELKDLGIISQEEFEKKKQDLLNKI
jgi:hypothetical protein